MTLFEVQQALTKGEKSAVDLVQESLHAIERWEPSIHAFLEVLADQAQAQAEQIDSRRSKGENLGPLAGIPIAVKDVICTTEGHTTAASKILATFQSPYQATVIKRLKDAGAIIIGKTNLDEFAMGSSTEYSAVAPTKNPWDFTRVAGGSSGGSVAAVAAGEVPAALGTDTGGSVRQPAGFCGVVGLKPTYGRVSRFGVIAYGSSLDQVGPITRTVKDAALLLEVLAGQDEFDATSSPKPVKKYTQHLEMKDVRIGVPQEFFGEGISHEVQSIVMSAIKSLEDLGAHIVDISLPLTATAVAVYYLIAKSEASTNLARYDALRFAPMEIEAASLIERYLESRGRGLGPEVKRAILMGTYALSAGYYDAWYKQASRVRTLIRREYEEAFNTVDVIAGPTAPEVAFPLGSKVDDPLNMYLSDALTIPMSVAGLPALSLPCGFAGEEGTSRRLPVGLQLTAPHFQEDRLFQVGHAYEQSQPWWKQMPSLASST